jgi:hypothetical protein
MKDTLRIRRDGCQVHVTLKGRIQAVPFPRLPRIEAAGTVIGDLVDVDLRLTADEAWKAGEMLQELARQAERYTRDLVATPGA